MEDAAGPPDKLKKSVSVSNVWQRATKEVSTSVSDRGQKDRSLLN